jgi:sugar phosphate isomerase/epimerase
LALAGVPASTLAARTLGAAPRDINSTIKGVQIGAITYSFNRLAGGAEAIVQAYVTLGLGEMELMSNHAETLAGAPAAGRGGRRGSMTPEQQAAQAAAQKALQDWRAAATAATFRPVRDTIRAAGIDLQVLCFNMNVRNTTDEQIEYAFNMANWLGVKAMSTSTQVSMAKRLAPFAERHRMKVGFHGHDAVDQPDEVHNEASFQAVMAASPYLGANLDVGHYTAAGGDAVDFIRKYHDRITNLHFKDMKRLQGSSPPARQPREVSLPGEHRVRVPGRSDGRDPEVLSVHQGRVGVALDIVSRGDAAASERLAPAAGGTT